jgi:hypothetical protein
MFRPAGEWLGLMLNPQLCRLGQVLARGKGRTDMQHFRTLAPVLLCPCLAALFAAAASAADKAADNDIDRLSRQVLELQEQMQQMKRQYEVEISELKSEVEKLKQGAPAPDKPQPEDEAARLRRLAQGIVGQEEKPAQQPEETVFKFGGLSLQQLNPEISIGGDFAGSYRHQDETRKRTEALMRALELNFQSYLDPFSRLKATTHITEEHVHLEEAYFTRFSMFENANVDIGKFRQQFGLVNRWHEHALDQVQYPLVVRRIFGDEGLAQTGASIDWILPRWGDTYQALTLQVTEGDNERLFPGNELGNPSMLFRYKNYRDLSRDTYFEFGLSGLFGWNDQWQVARGANVETVHDSLGTQLFGADLSVLWEPADQALYRNVEWRSEVYFLNRDLQAPDGSGRDSLNAWGAYSYLQSKVARNLYIGIRGDYYEPDSKDYAETPDASLTPLAYASSNPNRWQVSPYLTWWQSEWVRFRCEYDYAWGRGMEKPEHVVWLQATFEAGPHKHERY